MTAFDVMLTNSAGHPTLNIPDAPQDVTLTFVNRSGRAVMSTRSVELDGLSDERFHVLVRFRPGTLRQLDELRLASESSVEWCMRLAEAADGTQVLLLGRPARETWEPGESFAIRLQGVSADPRGGTRASRVEVELSSLAHTSGPAPRTVPFRHLLQLRIARSKAGAFDVARRMRSGSAALSGPFVAGFLDGPSVLDHGGSPTTIRIRVLNVSERPIDVSDDDDAASRIEVDYQAPRGAAPWGLLGAATDHATVSLGPVAVSPRGQLPLDMWELDQHLVRCTRRRRWGAGEWLELHVTVHTSAPPGDAPLIVRFVDFPDIDDGELVLLAHLSPLAIRRQGIEVTAPIRLWGSATTLELRAGGIVGDAAVPFDGAISAGEDGGLDLEARQGLTLTAPLTTVAGRMEVGGDAQVSGALHSDTQISTDGPLTVTGGVTMSGSLRVDGVVEAGSARVSGTVEAGAAMVGGALGAGSLDVAGTVVLHGPLSVTGEVTTQGGARLGTYLAVGGSIETSGGLKVVGGIRPRQGTNDRPHSRIVLGRNVRIFASDALFAIRLGDDMWVATPQGFSHIRRGDISGWVASPQLSPLKALIEQEEAEWAINS